MWHKSQIFVFLLVVIVHEYAVNASGTIQKKLKRTDIYRPNEHYLIDAKTKYPGRLTCLECDSADDPDCISNPNEEKLVDCFYPYMCYHYVNTTSTQRGCTNSISGNFLERCDTNQDECKVCTGTNCNNAPRFVTCSTCSSSVNCAALNGPKVAKSKICREYHDECFTYIGREGIERGCMSAKPDAFKEKCRGNEDKCSICVDPVKNNDCNRKIFDLEFCVECDSTKDRNMCKDRSSLFRNKICNTITSRDKQGCYLSMKGDHYQKGCIRDLTSEDADECRGQTEQCKTCDFVNCNMKKGFQSCAVCTSKDDFHCSGNYNASLCTDYMKEFCFQGVDEEGYTHRRCVTESEAKTHGFKPKQYQVLSENNSNTKTYPKGRLECYQCEGEQCKDVKKSSLKPAACAVYSTDNQCYTYRSEDNEIQRGCLADSVEIRMQCDSSTTNKSGKCVACNGNGCNSGSI